MPEENDFFKKELSEEELGNILWHLQHLENFYPCFKKMIEKK